MIGEDTIYLSCGKLFDDNQMYLATPLGGIELCYSCKPDPTNNITHGCDTDSILHWGLVGSGLVLHESVSSVLLRKAL